MDHSHDDVILPENDADVHVGATSSKPHKKHIAFFLAALVMFIALSGSLAYAIFNSTTNDPEPIDDSTPPADTFKYDREEFNEAMDKAEERLIARDFVAIDSILSDYAVPERMTASQKYRYYSFLARLYSEENLNNTELAEKSEAIAAESLNEIRKGEE